MDHGGYRGWRALCVLALFVALLDGGGYLLAEEPAAADPFGTEKPAEKPAQADKAKREPAPAKTPPQAEPPKVRPLPGQLQMRGGAVPLIRGRIAIGRPDAVDDDPIFFPADRATLQRLSKAEELLKEKRFGEAVRLLGDILEAPEDFFFQPKRDEPIHRSLKAEAQRLIGELPAEGREAYELLFGEMARRSLDGAVASGDTSALTEVSRRFFHTSAGYEATYLLAAQQIDHGQPLAAALSLKRLQGTPAGAKFEPALSVKLAACWLQAGMSDNARETLSQLLQQDRAQRVILAGKEVPLFHRDDEALSWLAQVAHVESTTPVDGSDQWPMYRGSASRNTISSGSSPLLSRRWAIPTSDTFGPPVEEMVRQLRETSQDQGSLLLCSLHPLAVKDLVLMRTVGGLLAVNFTTGKRVWPGPVDESIRHLLDPGAPSHSINQPMRVGAARQVPNPALANGPRWLSHRLYEDTTYGTMSSDGLRVFCIEDLDSGLGVTDQWQVVNPNGRRVTQTVGARSFNRLAAYDIATEGKLKWEAGGPLGEPQSELAGAFFLGPPLPLADKVYALSELKGEIRLVALDAATGKVEWTQQLAVLETILGAEQVRRSAGLCPSYSDGVLVCPTAAGAVVALDLTTRSLLWGYQYARNDGNAPEAVRLGMIRNPALAANNVGNGQRWTDASVTIAAGHVLLTPPESNQLHCLNLLDGKLLWQKPRDDGLYVGCVHEDKVLVIGRNSLRALALRDGSSCWNEASLPLPVGSIPTGRGFFNGKRYHLPLSTAEVAAIDVTTGQIVARSKSRTGTVPGNLICHRGAVISQSVDVIERFDQRDDLWQQIGAAIEADPKDAAALARRGELLLDEGNFRKATEDLRTSFDIAPDARTRDLLVDALLEGLRADFPAYRDQLADIEKLIDQSAQRGEFLRLVAVGWQKAGNVPAAFDAYMNIASLGANANDLERVDHVLSVRRDRWVQARLKELLEAASPADRAAMEKTIEERLATAVQAAGPIPLRTFLTYYGTLPIGDVAREALVARLEEEGSFAEAEQLLRRLEASGDPRRAARATAQYAALLQSAKRYDDAAIYYRRLADRFADEECLDGKSGRQIVEALPEKSDVNRLLAMTNPWPVGVVEREEGKSPVGVVTRHFALDLSGPLAPFYDNSTLCVDQQQQSLVGFDGVGRERWRVPLRDTTSNNNNNHTFFGNGQMNPARVSGHVVLVSMGYQVLAIDTLGGPGTDGARVLWRHDLIDRAPAVPFQPQPHVIQVPWAVPRLVVADQLGRPLGSIGPITPELACYQRMRSVIAVHPLTGESQWTRSDTEPGSDIFGDDEMLFIVAPNSEDALVVRALDGCELGRRKVAASPQRMLTMGRRVVSWVLERGHVTLEVKDAWAEKSIWQRQFHANAKAWVVHDEAVGVMTPDGKFTLLNLADGQALVDEKLDAELNLSEIYVLRSPDQYILATNRPIQVRNNINRQPVTSSIGNPLITGHVHFFDRSSGKKIGSLEVDRQGLLLSQPASLPVLTFATHVYDQRKNRSQNVEAELLFVDKRTAKIVHEEKLAQPVQQGIDISGDPELHEVLVRAHGVSLRLKFTGKPLADEAAAPASNDDAKESDTARAGKAVMRGFQNWLQILAPRPQSPGPQPQVPKPAAPMGEAPK
ncbi:MAG TPA: PQQ-binding-like beta-propeller repeat protein [Pirellulales bacterium]|nr:PQQ-binding-like beta-propeller repeat protein [Pirellulales bacterium]